MRVRPKRSSSGTRRLPGPSRRPHVKLPGRAEPEVAPEPNVPIDDHPDERRARESGGPLDRARYDCTCGYAFDAAVSTSVTCPHCGAGQAW